MGGVPIPSRCVRDGQAVPSHCVPSSRRSSPPYHGRRDKRAAHWAAFMKKTLLQAIGKIGVAVILLALCLLALFRSEWMQQRYGYGQDALATEKMLTEAYGRDPQGFDALVAALCRYETREQLLYEDHQLWQVVYDQNDLKYLPLDDQEAQAICDGMRELADWDKVVITFESEESNDTAMQSVTFSIMVNMANVPWGKSYVDISMRYYLNGKPEKEDVWLSGGTWLSDRWVIVFHGLV